MCQAVLCPAWEGPKTTKSTILGDFGLDRSRVVFVVEGGRGEANSLVYRLLSWTNSGEGGGGGVENPGPSYAEI